MIYLDHAATTKLAPEVLDKMMPYLTENYGNPSSVYSFSSVSKNAIAASRRQIAKVINASPNEIYFTAGGSEADNWALIQTAFSMREKGNHIITSSIEHHAILHTCEYLSTQGFEITYLPVDKEGFVNLDELEAAITPRTILISIMFANNEIGTIEPIKEISEIARKNEILFHTDAVQALGHIEIDVRALGIDMLSASGHKFNGPKGVGFLYLKRGVSIGSFVHGGHQERGLRAGTEYVPGIVGIGEAAELAINRLNDEKKYISELRDYFIDRVLNEIPYTYLNGPDIHSSDICKADRRLSNNVNISFEYVEGESLLILLDMKGICSSSGSACTSGSIDPSHVLKAIGVSKELAYGSLRFTLGAENTKEEIDFTVDCIKESVDKLRRMSPKYPGI